MKYHEGITVVATKNPCHLLIAGTPSKLNQIIIKTDA